MLLLWTVLKIGPFVMFCFQAKFVVHFIYFKARLLCSLWLSMLLRKSRLRVTGYLYVWSAVVKGNFRLFLCGVLMPFLLLCIGKRVSALHLPHL